MPSIALPLATQDLLIHRKDTKQQPGFSVQFSHSFVFPTPFRYTEESVTFKFSTLSLVGTV